VEQIKRSKIDSNDKTVYATDDFYNQVTIWQRRIESRHFIKNWKLYADSKAKKTSIDLVFNLSKSY
jgi:hypothetical protein